MNWQEIIDDFNQGDQYILKYFGWDIGAFFSALKKRGLLQKIDLDANGSDEWQNEFLLWLYDENKPLYYGEVERILSDIVVEGENHKVYWQGDREDLARLFCDRHRDDISQDTIAQILSGEGDVYEPYWDTTDNVYRDVIEELNKENLERLEQVVIEKLKGQQLSPESEEMELIASEQGHPNYWEITSDNVSRIVDDEQSMNSLLEDELSDLRAELYSIHSNSYNSAYENEVWKSIWKELNDYFEGQGEWISFPHQYKKDTTVQKFKIPISDFEGIINDFLYENKGYGSSGTLGYHGSFLEVVRESRDCLSARVPDYPDSREVDKNINLDFSDFI